MRDSVSRRFRVPSASRSQVPWIAALALLAIAACADERPRGPLDFTQDDQFAIGDPGGRQATATGIGCATTARVALTEAQRTAQYNLRGVMGPGRYRMRLETIRDYRDGERFCAEVEARVQY